MQSWDIRARQEPRTSPNRSKPAPARRGGLLVRARPDSSNWALCGKNWFAIENQIWPQKAKHQDGVLEPVLPEKAGAKAAGIWCFIDRAQAQAQAQIQNLPARLAT